MISKRMMVFALVAGLESATFNDILKSENVMLKVFKQKQA